MSFPNIPIVSPSITLNRSDVVNLLLASIAFEELGLAHVINAEGEKLQAVLGTLPGLSLTATSISQLLSVNQSVNRTLQTVLKTQMLLQFKLEDIQDILPSPPAFPSICDFRTCQSDSSCGGVFPCPSSPSGTILTVGTGQMFATIQAAINAANSGDEILVFPGTYREQISIPAGKNNLFIISQTPQAAIITNPVGGLTGNLSLVTVNATCTQIRGFTITGPSVIQGNLANGIFVTNGGSAVIQNNLISDIRDNPVSGLQQGAGINVSVGAAVISNNTITGYQKTGIRVNGSGSCASVLNNTVTGVGATNVIAQNGIQISRGATANVQGNTVTGNIYTGVNFVSTGILLFQDVSTAPVCVQFNNVSNNNIGLDLTTTDGSLVQGNNISNNTLIGISTESDSINNVFIRNTALNNPEFDIADFSNGSQTAMTANTYLCNTCGHDNKNGALCTSITESSETNSASVFISSDWTVSQE